MAKLCFTAKISTTIVINPTTIVVDQTWNGKSTELAFWVAAQKARSAKATKQQKQREKVDIEKLLDFVKHLNDGVIDSDLEIMVRSRANQHRNRVWATVRALETCFNKFRILSNCPLFVNQKRSLIYSAIDSCLKVSKKEDTTKRSDNRKQVSKKSADNSGGYIQLNIFPN